MKKSMSMFVLSIFATTSFCAYAENVNFAAELVVAQSNKDAQCKTFLQYFMEYLKAGETANAELLISLIDRKAPGLVDYCDATK